MIKAQQEIKRLLPEAERRGQTGDHRGAYKVLLTAWSHFKASPDLATADKALVSQLSVAMWRFAPHWWDEHAAGRIKLRRCRAADADFFKRCLVDPNFTHNFARHFGWTGDLGLALDKYGRLPPNDLRMLIWIICGTDGESLGLVTLSSIDLANRRAEYSLGLLGKPHVGVAVDASLLSFHHAFFMARLHRLYCNIYEDNALAPRNALRLGFRAEGRLVDHAYLPPGHYVTVQAMGLTRPQLQGTAYVVERAKRHIGKDWTVSVPDL